MKNLTFKITGVLLFLFSLLLVSNQLKAQELDKDLCEEFLAANELYLINSPVNTIKFTTSKGQTFTFEQLVQENWPSKKIIKIDEKEYNNLKNLRNKFHISIYTIHIEVSGAVDRGTIDGVFLKNGKAGLSYKYLYWLQIPLYQYNKGIAPERLNYTIANIKNMLENYKDKSYRDAKFYKTIGYKDLLKSDTLYVKRNDLMYPELLKKVYPYNFRIVDQDQWVKAISETKPNVLFVDYVRGDGGSFYNSANIYQAQNGKLIVSSYPWKGYGHTLTNGELKQIVK